MRGMRMRAITAILLGGLGLPAMAQNADPGEADSSAVLDLRFAGLDAVTPSAKDRAAYDAFRSLRERVLLLPGELEPDIDDARREQGEAILSTAWNALTGRFGLQIAPGVGPMGYGAAAWVDPAQPMSAGSFLDTLLGFAETAGFEIRNDGNGRALVTPFGPAPIQTLGTGDREAVFVRLGLNDAVPGSVRRYDLPENASPIFSLHLDVRALSGMGQMAISAQDPALVTPLQSLGLIGPDAPIVDFAIGSTRDTLLTSLRLQDARRLVERSVGGSVVPFEEADLRMLPRDVTLAWAGPVPTEMLRTVIDLAASQAGVDPYGEIENNLGVDLAAVLDAIGPRATFYQSESTGGGGVLSAVAIVDLDDRATIERTLDTLIARLHIFAEQEARGYLRVAERTTRGHSYASLTFPGLPVPLELSWAFAGDRLVFAASPTGLLAALEQIQRPAGHAGQNLAFRRAVADRMPGAGALAYWFLDAERFAGQGYGLMNLGVSALANAVGGPGREFTPEPIMPPYAEFMQDIHATGGVAIWNVDDVVVTQVSDESLLVLTASSFGQQGAFAAQYAAAGVGTLLPALGKARESAKQLKASTQVRSISMAATLYATNNRDRGPASIQVLVDEGFLEAEALVSPFGPAMDGGPDFAIVPNAELDFNTEKIIAIDRAMYLERGWEGTMVAFADNHVELVEQWRLDELLAKPFNEGAREALGIPED